MKQLTPSQVIAGLRRIATDIEGAESPDLHHVTSALHDVISRLAVEGFIDEETLVKTLEGALRGGKLSPEEQKHAKAMIESIKAVAEGEEEKKTASADPTAVSAELRKIASQIDASTNPNRGLVVRDIRRVLETLGR